MQGEGSAWKHWVATGRGNEVGASAANIWCRLQLDWIEKQCPGSSLDDTMDPPPLMMSHGVVVPSPVVMLPADTRGQEGRVGSKTTASLALRRLAVRALAAQGGPLDAALAIMERAAGIESTGHPHGTGSEVADSSPPVSPIGPTAKQGTACLCAVHLLQAWLHSRDIAVDAALIHATVAKPASKGLASSTETAIGANAVHVPRGRAMLPLPLPLQLDMSEHIADGMDEGTPPSTKEETPFGTPASVGET